MRRWSRALKGHLGLWVSGHYGRSVSFRKSHFVSVSQVNMGNSSLSQECCEDKYSEDCQALEHYGIAGI